MAIEVFNRYEHKYLTDAETYKRIVDIMDRYMELDKYNNGHKPYTIANIYYDTFDDYLIRKSLSSPIYKEKLRLRSYGIPAEKTPVYLEIKKKCNGIVNKRRTTLKLKEAYDFLESGTLPQIREYMNTQVMSEIEYFLSVYSLIPKVYIAYDRIAYFEKNNPDLRISFDQNIRTRRDNLHLECGDNGRQLLNKGIYLMEVKTSTAKPLWLSEILDKYNIKRTSFSKYGTEFKDYITDTDSKNNIKNIVYINSYDFVSERRVYNE